MCVCVCVCMSMHVGCKCNVVIATCPQRYLESTFLRCHNVVITMLSQPKDNVVTTLLQRDFVCWVNAYVGISKQCIALLSALFLLMMALSRYLWQCHIKLTSSLLRYLGFYISWLKVIPPSKVCRFLVLDIDSLKMEIRLPEDKLDKLINLLKKYVGKTTISKKELGSLGFCWLIAPTWWMGVKPILKVVMIFTK